MSEHRPVATIERYYRGGWPIRWRAEVAFPSEFGGWLTVGQSNLTLSRRGAIRWARRTAARLERDRRARAERTTVDLSGSSRED